jgi:uncharacterized protein YcnI
MGRWSARALAAVFAALVAVFAFAGIAYAHVEVSADPAVQGATNAVLTFTAEAESPTSGVASVRVVLPDGLTANDVSLNKAPDGWAFTAAADGYTVSGPALPKGQEAVHSIIVTHLPDMPSLTFKAIVTYADGSADHWIDDKTAANPDPPHPAPVLVLTAPGAKAANPTATASFAPVPAVGSGSSAWVWWLIVAIVVVAVVVGVLLRRRRSPRTR